MDIWAFGCLFYEMITLKPLFPGKDELDQINRIFSALGSPRTDLFKKYQK